MDALVWVESWQVQSYGGVPFAVDQKVTWPVDSRFNEEALVERVGAETAARVSLGVEWHPDDRKPTDTVDYTGIVSHIEAYFCRLARGHVVPGSVETHPVVTADGWEEEQDGVWFSGYLVTLTNVRQSADR